MRDSFIFYRSFYESWKTLKTKEKQKLFEAICEYALNDTEIELSGAADGMFKLLKPQLDANTRKYENGCKGGRPKAPRDKTKPKPNNNLNVTKPKANRNAMNNDNDNDNDNDNVNVNDNDNALGSSGGGSGSDDGDDFNLWKKMSFEDIDAVYEAYPESGGILIDEVYQDVKRKRKTVRDPVAYIIGYAKNVGWDDKARAQ